MVTRRPTGAEPHKFASSVPAALPPGALANLEDDAHGLVLRQMHTLHLKSGSVVFHPGSSCANYILVKKGSVRVSVMTEAGREIVLYRVQDGETCVLTTAALMSGESYDAEAMAETETEVVILPKAAFEELLASSPRFRQFVFTSYGERLQTLITLVQEVTVRHVDRRLARHLLRMAKSSIVESTHQTIANELSTAREVVTRLLHDFEERGWLETARGRITLKDALALEAFADAL